MTSDIDTSQLGALSAQTQPQSQITNTYAIGLVTTLPPNGAWFVHGTDYHANPLALFGDELSARRYADARGYGHVVFWPFGKTWDEVSHG